MRKLVLVVVAVSCIGMLSSLSDKKELAPISDELPVADLLQTWGTPAPLHTVKGVTKLQIKQGRELVHLGITRNESGKKTSRQSKYFVCTSCHNTEREDPIMSQPDPEGRLAYVDENNLPFLQGSALYGIVNRESWYNDDYKKKYGSLVDNSRDTLVNAIQLCATVCSQGRALEPWEMNAVLAYLWSIELKVGDLSLNEDERKQLNSDAPKAEKIKLIKSKYYAASPATFGSPPEDKKAGLGISGRHEKGKIIYEKGCLHCHLDSKYAQFNLDDSKLSLQFLKNKLEGNTRFSVYNIVRHGTHPEPGHKAYMPHYPLERMSDQQVEDLVAYIRQNG